MKSTYGVWGFPRKRIHLHYIYTLPCCALRNNVTLKIVSCNMSFTQGRKVP